MSDAAAVEDAVYGALARQLGSDQGSLRLARDRGLDELGLDSQGLMRVLLDIEAALGLDELELPDEAYDSPASLCRAVGERAG